MSKISRENTKLVLTPEQKLALGRVYGFLMEIGKQRLNRLQATNADGSVSLQLETDSASDNATVSVIDSE